VKGAYKGDTKESGIPLNQAFCSMAHYLKLQDANRPAIATHDEEILKKIDDNFYDYEFLYGIRRDLQKDLKKREYTVRVYVPFGENWLPYTIRRLKEWKNLKFVIKNILKEWFKL
jgi:proline dehydrogenase